MKRGTTPTIALTLEGIDFAFIDKAELTIVQHNEKKLIKQLKINVEKCGMYTVLNQLETLSLEAGKCTLQVKILFIDGSVIATDAMTFNVQEILNDEVIV